MPIYTAEKKVSKYARLLTKKNYALFRVYIIGERSNVTQHHLIFFRCAVTIYCCSIIGTVGIFCFLFYFGDSTKIDYPDPVCVCTFMWRCGFDVHARWSETICCAGCVIKARRAPNLTHQVNGVSDKVVCVYFMSFV